MPLILDRNAVLDVHARAAAERWVIPTFCTENLTTTEAILSATLDHSQRLGQPDIPVTIAITNRYTHRSQSVNYTHTRRWDVGLNLFLADLHVLTAHGSPFEKLSVMVHLDHTQWDLDRELLEWDMKRFSSIMFDASSLPFGDNIRETARFVEKNGYVIVIEGACDEIADAGGAGAGTLTTPEKAVEYRGSTGVDFIVANLGTEHRAHAADLHYHADLARRISRFTGPCLVLHGTSSVELSQIGRLFDDGIAKVNIWTTLERDSAPVLLEDMIRNASRILDRPRLDEHTGSGLLGPAADTGHKPSLTHYTTAYRQELIFNKMKAIVQDYLQLWYTG